MDKEDESTIKMALVKTGHAILQLGLVRLAVKFFPGLTGLLTPAVQVAYERVKKNADLPALVDEATTKLKEVQSERGRSETTPPEKR